MKVRFSDVDEFCEELAKDGPPTRIVRVTLRYQIHPTLPINSCFCHASYVNALGYVVYLDAFCGEVWQRGAPGNDETEVRRDSMYQKLEVAIAAADCESRPGMFERNESDRK